ncbi:N-6 DNA methylase [Schaalia turicensis]|uniref:N-6 DNA methylase n=1 Tax=Schaalia turicensis TaxID=131111 RepID=UPI002B4BA180|nr:N-6 DNA methylase [Schaalia turicensis]
MGKVKLIYIDPTFGSGSLLINIGKAVAKRVGSSDGIKYFAQELKENTYNLTRMNLIMRGILPSNITARNGDTLEDDWPYFDESDPAGTYNPLYVDAVVSNPPYSQRWDPTDKDVDPRYAYGLAPKSKAYYAFLLHDLYRLRPEVIMCIVLPHGVLFRGGEEGQIRRNLLENRHIQAIIGLPANIFFGTGIPTIIMVLRQKRDESDVLIVDASKGFEKVGKNNKLRACDIKRISDVVCECKSVEGFSRLVSLDEIRSNDCNLNIPRYVDSSDRPESWDIYASMFGGIPASEVDELERYWNAWPSLRDQLFAGDGAYVTPAVEDVRAAIEANPDVMAYRESFNACVEPVIDWVHDALVSDPCAVDAARMEQSFASKLFEALEGIELADPYAAYQALDDTWTANVSLDLEVLQSEGMSAATKVDPHMMIKKNNKEVEVQDGWEGRVIPFYLIEVTLLKDQSDAIKALEEQLSACTSDIGHSVEELSEEERETLSEALDDDNAVWKAAEVKKLAKALATEAKTDPELKGYAATLKRVQDLINEQKKVKGQIKTATAELHASCKETIEALTDEQVRELLSKKWIAPFANAVYGMPSSLVDDLASKVDALSSKYETTLKDLSELIENRAKAYDFDSVMDVVEAVMGNEYSIPDFAFGFNSSL